MNHATEGMLQAYLDDEVAGPVRRDIAEHLGACAACASEYQTLQAAATRVGALLGTLDAPVLVQPALETVRRRRAAAQAPAGQLSRRWRGALMRAALFVVASASVVSATVPGSPVRQWLASAWDRVATFFAGERPTPTAPAEVPPAVVIEEAGAWIAPYQGRVRVVLEGALPTATIRIQLVERQRAGVTAVQTGARFSTASGRIEAADIGSRDIVVELPVGAQSAIVEVNGRIVASKDGDALVAHVPTERMAQQELVLRPER